MKQIKKILVAMILVFALFLVACENKECPECPSTECNPSEVCQGLIDPSTCPEGPTCPEPTCDECPTFNTDKECAAAGWVKECLEGIVAPASVEFYAEDIVVGGTAKFEVEIEPANAFAGLLWLTSDPAIATVAEDGTITGVKPGKVIITAKSVLNGSVSYSEEVEVVERGLQDYEIAEREKNAIVAALQGYVSGSFDLPTTWNASAKVVYTDPNGREITRFEMPDLGEATSQNYALSGSVTYRDSVSEFNVTLKLVKVAEGKNDYEKVQFATEVAEAFLYEYLEGKLVEGDITLPVSVYGVALNWTSNKAYVLANDGKFARPNNNDTVTYTITPKLGAASASKTFAITAKGYTKDEKIAYLLKDGALALANGGKFVGSIALPEYDDKFGIKLAYVSGSPELISNDGKINEVKYDYDDQKVTFTVTAIYNDLNAASEAFTEVFTFDTYIAKYNEATEAVINFAKTHTQFEDHPFGAGTGYSAANNTQVILAANALSAEWKIEGDENFKINATNNEVQLVTQYFRYHEATLKFTHILGEGDEKKEASFYWTINIGIGAEPHITYLGGRSHSYQASANPNERGDSLQGFSKWDKYVGVVANNNERTSQQYWSEFSGYTAYVDVPVKYNNVQYNKVIYTLDAEGNVAIYPTDEKEHVRQQMFFMEFAALHIGLSKEEYYAAAPVMEEDEEGNEKQKTEVDADGNTVGVYEQVKDDKGNYVRFYYPVLKNFESVRSTYGGNFGSLYINETGKDLEIPVCAVVVDAGGKFLDGEDIKGAAKASISAYEKVLVMKKDSLEGYLAGLTADKYEYKLVVLKDDYGANTSVKREQSWALDGYRPAMMVAPKTGSAILAEGSVNVEYKFTFGIQLSNENDKFVDADGNLKASNYAQYGVNSTKSESWGTPYVELKAGGLGFAWHSQTLYSFSAMGEGYIAGKDMDLPIYFSRYYRHAENEELSDYVRNDIRTYFMALSGLTRDEYDALGIKLDEEGNELETLNYEDFRAIELQFDDLSIAELEKIEKLQARLDALHSTYKEKNDVERAVLALRRIIDVASYEANAQKQYIIVTKGLFDTVVTEYKSYKNLPLAGTNSVAEKVADAEFQAKYATAKRNYAALTPAQKDLFDKGYTPASSMSASFKAAFTFTANDYSYIEQSIKLVEEITELSDKITDANKAKVEEVYDKVYRKVNKYLPNLYDASKPQDSLLPTSAVHKMDMLMSVIKFLETKPTDEDIEKAYLTFIKLKGDGSAFSGIDLDGDGTLRAFAPGTDYYTERDLYSPEAAFNSEKTYYVASFSAPAVVEEVEEGVAYYSRSGEQAPYTYTYVEEPANGGTYCVIEEYEEAGAITEFAAGKYYFTLSKVYDLVEGVGEPDEDTLYYVQSGTKYVLAKDYEITAYEEYPDAIEYYDLHPEAFSKTREYYTYAMSKASAYESGKAYYTRQAKNVTYEKATKFDKDAKYYTIAAANIAVDVFNAITDLVATPVYVVDGTEFVEIKPAPVSSGFDATGKYIKKTTYTRVINSGVDAISYDEEVTYYVAKSYQVAVPQPTSTTYNNGSYYIVSGDGYANADTLTQYSDRNLYYEIKDYREARVQPTGEIAGGAKTNYFTKADYVQAGATFDSKATYYAQVPTYKRIYAAVESPTATTYFVFNPTAATPTSTTFKNYYYYTQKVGYYAYTLAEISAFAANTEYFVVDTTKYEKASVAPIFDEQAIVNVDEYNVFNGGAGRKYLIKVSLDEYLKHDYEIDEETTAKYYTYYYPKAVYTLAQNRQDAVVFYKLDHGKYVVTEVGVNFEFGEEGSANARYYVSTTPAGLCSDDQAYFAASFKDIKNTDGSTTWGLDDFFANLYETKANNEVAQVLANIARTVTLAADIKTDAALLPSAREVRNSGFGSLESKYNGLMKYNEKLASTGKVDELVRLYASLGVIDGTKEKVIAANTEYVDKKDSYATIAGLNTKLGYIKDILVNVTGIYEPTEDTAAKENKVYYTVVDSALATTLLANYGITLYEKDTTLRTGDALSAAHYELVAELGNFSGIRENLILETLFDLPAAKDEYVASGVTDAVRNLPSMSKVAISDEAAVKAVITKYNALSHAQWLLVNDATYSILDECDALLNKIELAKLSAKLDPVHEAIDALPDYDKIELTDEDAIFAAYKLWAALKDAKASTPFDYQDDFDAVYSGDKTALNNAVSKIRQLITESILEDEAYVAAFEAFSETELVGMVNAANLDACKDLVAKYEALSGVALDYFKDCTDEDAHFVIATAETLTKSGLDFEVLYTRLLATIRAYEAYTTPAE